MLTAHQSPSGSLQLPGSAPKDSDYIGWGGGRVWPGHQDFNSTPGVFNVQPSLRTTELEEVEVERPVKLLQLNYKGDQSEAVALRKKNRYTEDKNLYLQYGATIQENCHH